MGCSGEIVEKWLDFGRKLIDGVTGIGGTDRLEGHATLESISRERMTGRSRRSAA